MSAWIWLAVAILFEVAGTTSLKISNGFSKGLPSLCTCVFYAISFYMLAITLKSLDVGLSYAMWAGLGTALISCIGVLYFGEPISLIKVISLILIIAGVVGLNLTGNMH
jgi:small multidrug resistance pump